jgi:hypothetical protein
MVKKTGKDKGDIYLGKTALKKEFAEVKGSIVDIGGEKYYKIANYHRMPDFFMTIVSDSDHWMYISSNGSLSAGRKNRDNALFPYYTVDKIHDYRDKTGSKTVCLVTRDNRTYLWEPFAADYEMIYRLERNLYKSTTGNKIIFEEKNLDLEISFHYGWYNSEKFGWIKKSVLENSSNQKVNVDILDGIRNILPYGTDFAFQNEYSNLLEAYRKSELLPESRLGLFLLSSIPVDKAEPSEALKATVVWSVPPDSDSDPKYLLSDNQLENFRTGGEIITESDVFASRGSYYINSLFRIDGNDRRSWYLIADVNKDSSDVVNLDHYLRDEKSLNQKIEEDIATGTANLVRIVAGADGLQAGRDELITARHFSNTLFNLMRGGVFINSYHIDTSDFRLFVRQCNREISDKFSVILEELPHKIHFDDLIVRLKKIDNPDLERIGYEYLPLTFSRRHGDPSRPWNQFSIETKKDDGTLKLDYQGNWRDIFQNWEALTLSYPEFIESIICKFVNATTADGYNPYRLTRTGMDWERPDPDDPWAYIGYWGDHQIIYLQKFLEQSDHYHPGKIDELLERKIFVYANVPYRIKSIDQIIENPKDTILFDGGLDRKIGELADRTGADARLLTLSTGEIYRVNLMEKVLCSLLAKLTNFIPEAGIWLNTQRPEWNDANNALVGNGVSMVTLSYLRRSVAFWTGKLGDTSISTFNLSAEVLTLFEKIFTVLDENKYLLKKGFSDSERFSVTWQLGRAGSDYRESIYKDSFSGELSVITRERLLEFMQLTLAWIEQSIERNRRSDSLYHSYNLVSFKSNTVSVRNLYEMLEGQVAVLSSGYLDADRSIELLDALRASKLFRRDQESYLLYPFRRLPVFTEKNVIAPDKIVGSELLNRLILDNNRLIITRDTTGNYHFKGTFRNRDLLSKALENLDSKRYGVLVEKEKRNILDIYESVFDHQSFTGRSGTFYGYEGLGSIYWHMVSKLMLAVQERFVAGKEEGTNNNTLQRILDHYYEIRKGLGTHKSPAQHGAFPTDAYSHTPAGAGAKQPGLTGQVKEDIITRFGELGVIVREGRIRLASAMFRRSEMLIKDKEFIFIDVKGKKNIIKLHSDQFAFTLCQVPVVYTRGAREEITVRYTNGTDEVIKGGIIDEETSHKIFRRNGEVVKIEFTIN